LTQAGMMTVVVPGGPVELNRASEEQLEYIRSTRSKSGTMAVARKALKAMGLIGELKIELEKAGMMSEAAPIRAQSETQIVPFRALARPVVVEAAHVQQEAGGKQTKVDEPLIGGRPWAEIEVMTKGLLRQHRRALAPYMWAGKLIKFLIWFFPLCMIYGGVFYGLCCIGYILAKPQIVVSMVFNLVDAIPNYASYASAAMFEQLKIELRERLR
jgi:hypothetical protein